MRIKGWNNKIINSSTLLGLMNDYIFYPRASHGAIIVNAFQAFGYPGRDRIIIATGATRGLSVNCKMNPIVGSTLDSHYQ